MTKEDIILLYFDTSALVTAFHHEINVDLLSKIITTSTNRNNLQIISSIWTINEIIAIIDRLLQKINEKTGFFELSDNDIKKIISTIVERIRIITSNNDNAMFKFVYLDHDIITDSRILTKNFHLPLNDAIHMLTGYAYNCNYFIVHNKYFINQFPFKKYDKMKLIDLTNENDRKLLERELNL